MKVLMRSSSVLITFVIICLTIMCRHALAGEVMSTQPSIAANTIDVKPAAVNTKAIRKMAQIMLQLKHYPSESDKKMLQDISLNTANADDERIIATALMNLHHQVHSADRPRLKAIVNDDATSSPAKTLATIMLNLDHTLSSVDRETLEELLKQ